LLYPQPAEGFFHLLLPLIVCEMANNDETHRLGRLTSLVWRKMEAEERAAITATIERTEFLFVL